jgi:hypothetical protein
MRISGKDYSEPSAYEKYVGKIGTSRDFSG